MNGRVSVVGLDPQLREKAERETKAILEHMSPKGAFAHLGELLDERRVQYGLIDELFKVQAAYGYVLVHQISQLETETYGDTRILMPDTVKDRETKEAPRGIIVAAGLAALDALRSNGIDLGHIVAFARTAPYRLRAAIVAARSHHLIVLQAGDIIGSEDTAAAMKDGTAGVHVSTDADTGFAYHYYRGADGAVWKPQSPHKTANI
jgi:hypothetical protein